MISFGHKGDFARLSKLFEIIKDFAKSRDLDKYGRAGVAALELATPRNTGKTAQSWTYKVTYTKTGARIDWLNTNVQNGVNIAIILQYGHATGNGGWVEGRDYINPAIQPVFDKIAQDAFEEVSK